MGSDALLGTTIGSWRVARLLGAGGMGRVYVAVQPKIGARVAIKVLKRDSSNDPEVVERFFNEARAVNLIKHEAIVDVIDLGQLPDGAPYIVMEYLDGASLGAIIRAAVPLPLGTVARIVDEVLAALEAVHAKGIIHRDLKPDNIFVSPSGRVTVLDFGVAKLAVAEGMGSTQTGSLLGTPAYMSPEQARSQPLDRRSDLYAVGVILYEGTTKKLPFVAANVFDLLQMHVAQPPRPPRELAPEMPEALEAVILRALAKAPADRFATAHEMREALATSVAGLPQSAVTAIVLPRESGSTKQKPSDPFAETAASDSIATDKTQAAPSEKKTEPKAETKASSAALEPRPTDGVHLSRRTLYTLLGSFVVLVLGCVALFAFVTSHKSSTAGMKVKLSVAEVPEPDAAPVIVADAPPPIVDAGTPQMAALTPADAGTHAATRDAGNRQAIHAQAVPADAAPAVTAQGGIDAGTKSQKMNALSDTPGPFAVPNPRTFDPIAYARVLAKRATGIGGKSTRMTVLRIHQMNRQGFVDLTNGGEVDIYFSSPERAKADLPCYIEYTFEKGAGDLQLGQQEAGNDCGGGVYPPKCSGAQMFERALAVGLPADAVLITLNKFLDNYAVSTPATPGVYVDDDCK